MTGIQKNLHDFAQHKQILPIVDVDTANDITPTIQALIDGGMNAVEITLRHPCALEAVMIARQAFPDLCLSVGTVTDIASLEALKDYAIDFFITPGINRNILEYCQQAQLNLLPGIATPSEILLGLEYQLKYFKFFPAETMGGIKTLKAFQGPFKTQQFCATGGVNEQNFIHYLALENSFCVGGSWLANREHIQSKNWPAITQKAIDAKQQLNRLLTV